MRNSIFSTTLSILVALNTSYALAGSATTSHADFSFATVPALTPPDWSGFHFGIFASRDAGSGNNYIGATPQGVDEILSGKIYGGLAGYNFQQGKIVYGAEFAYSEGKTPVTSAPANELTSFFDAKARVGYTFDSTMIYGVAGGAIGVFNRAGSENLDTRGLSYGIGIDVMLTKTVFFGVEYLVRDLRTENSTIVPAEHWEFKTDSLQIRSGIVF